MKHTQKVLHYHIPAGSDFEKLAHRPANGRESTLEGSKDLDALSITMPDAVAHGRQSVRKGMEMLDLSEAINSVPSFPQQRAAVAGPLSQPKREQSMVQRTPAQSPSLRSMQTAPVAHSSFGGKEIAKEAVVAGGVSAAAYAGVTGATTYIGLSALTGGTIPVSSAALIAGSTAAVSSIGGALAGISLYGGGVLHDAVWGNDKPGVLRKCLWGIASPLSVPAGVLWKGLLKR